MWQKKVLTAWIFALAVTACAPQAAPVSQEPVVSEPTAEAATATPQPSPTAPPHHLTVCLGREPETLFPLQAHTRAAQTVLAVVYDGPFHRVHFAWQPTILSGLPSLENGDVTIETVTVQAGDEVLDADGQPVTLDDGVRVRPAGCRQASCAQTFTRDAPLQMEQMSVVFHLKEGLRWADGEPLTAADSVYAWQLAQQPQLNTDFYLLDRTADYRALDTQTVVWVGKPGFLDAGFQNNFWTPLPSHLWSQLAPANLPDSDFARLPLGWGPYVMTDWTPGVSIELKRNPIYAGTAPYFDTLTFRFVSDGAAAVADLLAGRCDVLDSSVPLAGEMDLLREMSADGQVRLLASTDMTMEVLAPGIQPAAYDDGYQPGLFGDRPDYFGDARMRQALAYCLDRQRVVNEVLDGLSYVPDSVIPNAHPLFDPSTPTYSYDPEKGRALLDEIGWKDLDNDPSTPLTAWAVTGIPQGTPLVLQYWTTNAPQRQDAAQIFQDSLAACGIGLETHFLPPEDFFADGPDGVLFGRQFELAQYAMGVLDVQPPCYWYLSDAVPSSENAWIGTNLSGYHSVTYDAVCRQALLSLPGEMTYIAAWQRVSQLFGEDLPVIPLYARLRLAAARPDLCGLVFDTGVQTLTWNIADWSLDEKCPDLP